MTGEFISEDDEFYSAEANYMIVRAEYKQRIQKVQKDLQTISDPEIKGFAENLYLRLRKEYFDLLKADIGMQIATKTENCIEDLCYIFSEKNEVK